MNLTDVGHVIAETPEDMDAKFRGPTEVKGWDSVRDAVDESLENYLAERHNVAMVYLVDYYISDMKVNITASKGLCDEIERSASKNFMSIAEDEGGEVEYDENPGYWTNWRDFDYAYLPRDITAAEWATMKKELSNEVRKDTISMVGLTLARPTDVIDPMFGWSPLSIARTATEITGDLDLDTTYQETNALIGSILTGYDYTAVDAEDLDAEMETSSASGWDVVDDGKTTTSGLSLVTCYGSILVWIIVGIVASSIAIVAILAFAKKKKRKRKKKH
jgi:hypothetical protein